MNFTCLDPWDKGIFFAFQKIQSPVMDCLLGYPTLLGNSFFLLSAVIILIFFLDRERAGEKITAVVFTVMTTYWATEFLKDLLARPRPYRLWSEAVLTFGTAWSASFPSGHAATAFAVAHTLNKIYNGKMPWLYAVAAWAGLTRIYTGVHYPTDVLAGAVLGIACSAAVGAVIDRTFSARKA
jgi:undecaprenyl-diphosphatase